MPSTTEIIVLSVLGLAVLALGVRAFRPRRTVPARVVPANPGRLLIDTMQELGKDAAGKLIETRLGEHEARKFMGDMAAAFGNPPAPAAPPPPTPPSPNG